MKILVVGGGGREHAVIKAIKKNKDVKEIYACPGNGGMANDATLVDIKATDLQGIVDFAVEKKIDYAIVTPDDPLCLGCVDALNEKGIPCFGPDKKAAIIEGSKAFSKNLMKKYGIPTAKYEVFTERERALEYLKSCDMPIVIKADGLALGKGVIIANNMVEAVDAVNSMMADKVFGAFNTVIFSLPLVIDGFTGVLSSSSATSKSSLIVVSYRAIPLPECTKLYFVYPLLFINLCTCIS